MIELAIATRISPLAWLDMGEQAIATAWEILDDQADAIRDTQRG